MTFALTAWHLLAGALALVGGASTIGAVIAAGVAQRWLRPLIDAGITAHETHPDTLSARERLVRAVIDDAIQRDDGLIRRHTRAHRDGIEEKLDAVLQAHVESGQRLAQIEGMVGALLASIVPSPPGTRTPPLGSRPSPLHGVTDPTPVRGAPRIPRRTPEET